MGQVVLMVMRAFGRIPTSQAIVMNMALIMAVVVGILLVIWDSQVRIGWVFITTLLFRAILTFSR
jgi:hypothetical protein